MPNSFELHPTLANFAPAVVIFDKDGTLIEFQSMWETWITGLARTLETATGRPVSAPLFAAMAFEPETGYIAPDGALALLPPPQLRAVTAGALATAGLSAAEAEAVLAAHWADPDPAALAHPLTDLPRLFAALHGHGSKVAVATSDGRQPTLDTLAHWHLLEAVDAIVCGDDALPIKPAPDMILSVCRQLGVSPARAAMVGDNVVDLQMARAAGAGLAIGVLSGVCPPDDLAGQADLLLGSIDGLMG